jgi:lipid-A-disaccharide synthase
MLRLLVVSGEPSGEVYAAELLRELRARTAVEAFGLGGDRMAAQGVELLAHVRDLAVVGLLEVVAHLPHFRRVYRRVLAEVDRRRPAAAILVDYPDFNLRLARALKRRGIPVVYYVSPQVWAWRRGRIRQIRDTVARMIVLFPFEEPLYREAGVPVTFAGHPLVDLVRKAPDAAAFLAGLGLDPGRPMVALLPGSRRKEVAHNLPGMAGAVERLAAERPALQFVAAAAPTLDPALLADAFRTVPVRVVHDRTHETLSAAAAAIVASGTATIEAALLEVPMVVVYRLSPLTYRLGRRFVRVPHVAMANLIAGRRLVPELIQEDFTPGRVAAEVVRLLGPDGDGVRDGLREVRRRLGAPGASARAAGVVLETLAVEKD